MKNKVNLITYVDRLGGKDLQALNELISGPLAGIFGGIHLLPFFDPIDGADAGFDPIDHTQVDHRLGDWTDIKRLGEKLELTADIIVNHMSAQSPFFQDYLMKGDTSEYKDLFLRMSSIFPDGANEETLMQIYRPRPGLPFTVISRKDGKKEIFWTTFTSNQIDINVKSEAGQKYLNQILSTFAANGVKLIRLDAAGYAIKKAGSSSFMIPETFDFIDELTQKAHSMNMEVLVEIHSYYKEQIEIAKKVDYVYDFALPPLILHAIYNQTGAYLNEWLKISPKNAITVLDTHDGIGVIDIGPHSQDKSKLGLVPNDDIDRLVKEMHKRTKGTSLAATGEAASNLDLYQVNSTYYDAVGQDDDLYILARAIQFFSPGLPQVYYVGLLGEVNDMDLLKKTNNGRDINRPYLDKEMVLDALKRPVTTRLIRLIKHRNNSEAFDGTFSSTVDNNQLSLEWNNGELKEKLVVDFNKLSCSIVTHDHEGTISTYKP